MKQSENTIMKNEDTKKTPTHVSDAYRMSHYRMGTTCNCSLRLVEGLVSIPCSVNGMDDLSWPSDAPSRECIFRGRTFWRTPFELEKIRYTPYALLLAATRRYRYSTYGSTAHHGTGSSLTTAYTPLYRLCREILATRRYDSSKTGSTHNIDIQYSTLLADWLSVSRVVCLKWEQLKLQDTPEMRGLFNEFDIRPDEWFSAWSHHLAEGYFSPVFDRQRDAPVLPANWPELFMAKFKDDVLASTDPAPVQRDEPAVEDGKDVTGKDEALAESPATAIIPQILPPASASEYIKGPAKRFNVTAEARLEYVLTYAADATTLERCVRILHLDEVQDSGVEITVPKDSNCIRVDVTVRQFADAPEASGSSRLDAISRAEKCVDRIDGQVRGLLETLSKLDYAGVLGLPAFD